MNLDVNLIKEKIKKNGITKIDDFLDQKNLDFVEKILGNYKEFKGVKSSFIFRSKGNFFLKKFFYFEWLSIINSLKLLNLAKKLKLNELSTKIIGKKTKLTYIDSYFQKISNEKILDWHTDQAYSGNLNPKKYVHPDHACLKYFIYLNDVDSNNGCLGYVPGSHKILYHLKLGIFKGEIDYKPYWKLKDLRKLVAEDYQNYLEKKISKEIINKFLDATNFINKNNNDTTDYDFILKKGGAVIFDESGVHRGAEPLKTNRLVLRFVYKVFDAPEF